MAQVWAAQVWVEVSVQVETIAWYTLEYSVKRRQIPWIANKPIIICFDGAAFCSIFCSILCSSRVDKRTAEMKPSNGYILQYIIIALLPSFKKRSVSRKRVSYTFTGCFTCFFFFWTKKCLLFWLRRSLIFAILFTELMYTIKIQWMIKRDAQEHSSLIKLAKNVLQSFLNVDGLSCARGCLAVLKAAQTIKWMIN